MREIDIEQLAEVLVEGAAIIDVHQTSEYVDTHVPGAVSIAMSRLTSRLDELDRTRAWIRSGRPVVRGVGMGATR